MRVLTERDFELLRKFSQKHNANYEDYCDAFYLVMNGFVVLTENHCFETTELGKIALETEPPHA